MFTWFLKFCLNYFNTSCAVLNISTHFDRQDTRTDWFMAKLLLWSHYLNILYSELSWIIIITYYHYFDLLAVLNPYIIMVVTIVRIVMIIIIIKISSIMFIVHSIVIFVRSIIAIAILLGNRWLPKNVSQFQPTAGLASAKPSWLAEWYVLCLPKCSTLTGWISRRMNWQHHYLEYLPSGYLT